MLLNKIFVSGPGTGNQNTFIFIKQKENISGTRIS